MADEAAAVPVRPECPDCKKNLPGKGGGPCTRCREARKAARGEEVDLGPITAAKMQKVFGQGKDKDKGPAELRLREWLNHKPAEYMAEMKRRERDERDDARVKAECETLRARVKELEGAVKPDEEDGGSDRVEALIERLLGECEAEVEAELRPRRR